MLQFATPSPAQRRSSWRTAGTAAFCYDANGNLTADGTSVYLYDVENRLVEKRAQGTGNTNCASLSYAGALQAALRYDPLARLYEVTGGAGTARMLYDGDALTAEYDASGTLLRRYTHGADLKADDPIAWYEGSAYASANERVMRSDWQGSIVLVTDSSGANVLAINRYDEYGIPQGTNAGRFQFTSQAWIGELGMYYYKARIYAPTLGRFLQTDPIGYKDQVNLYAYVGNDPVNGLDPTGLIVEANTCGRTGGSACSGSYLINPASSEKFEKELRKLKDAKTTYDAAKKKDQQNICTSGVLNRKDVKDAMRQAIHMGDTTPAVAVSTDGTAVRMPRTRNDYKSEAGFQFGYTFTGGSGVGSVYTNSPPATSNVSGGNHLSSLSSGIVWATAFFHYHPDGSELSDQDIAASNQFGIAYIAFDSSGGVSCHAPK